MIPSYAEKNHPWMNMDELGRQTHNFGMLPKLEMKHDKTEETLEIIHFSNGLSKTRRL